MCKILLSIKPEYVKKLFDGSKKYEFRKRCCKKPVSKIIVYATRPIMKVVGEMEVNRILSGTPACLWEQTQGYAGISKDLFFKYFEDRTVAYGYEIGQVTRYSEARDLSEYGVTSAPQSFIYLNEE